MFAKEGYKNVSMRKIAKKIGYSPTTIYLYFKIRRRIYKPHFKLLNFLRITEIFGRSFCKVIGFTKLALNPQRDPNACARPVPWFWRIQSPQLL
jgi:hypothetical protein